MNEKITVWIGETDQTPLGKVWVAMTSEGLWAIEYDVSRNEFTERVTRRGNVNILDYRQNVEEALQQVSNYLNGKSKEFDLPIDWRGMTEFQRKVRQAVMDIPAGEIASYKEIAVQLGKPEASRAVGRVNATNPIPLVIPCHRVLASDGKLTGYGGKGGVDTKAWLLELEEATLLS
ncbi:MAG: methylated-DNA--[protein]-cysteine S-methyltransferase [Chloroflexi bacterium]|nr:methylated-DNA--[protein]-cysteine S-methyltransferase [Chloroflexota bacterium]